MGPRQKHWVRALRSGNYQRHPGQWHLRIRGKGYSTLGVLCAIAVKKGVIGTPERDGEKYLYEKGSHGQSLPQRVVEWIGLRNSVGWHTTKGFEIHDSLFQLSNKHTFEEMADFLEECEDTIFIEEL